MLAVLALRAVSPLLYELASTDLQIHALPQWHHDSNMKDRCTIVATGRLVWQFTSMFPSLIFGRGRNAYDEFEWGCGLICDVFTSVSTSIFKRASADP